MKQESAADSVHLTLPCRAVAVAVPGPEPGRCLPEPSLPGAQSEGCTTRSLSGRNTSASADLQDAAKHRGNKAEVKSAHQQHNIYSE